MPPALVAAALVVGAVALLLGSLGVLGWLVANELPGIIDALEVAYNDIRSWFDETLGVGLPQADELVDEAERWVDGAEAQQIGLSFVVSAVEVAAGFLFALVGLFFYLKDPERFTEFAVRIAPHRYRDDVREVGQRMWDTVGQYFRGQLIVAAVDAFFIGLGLVLLDIPLAFALAAFIFFGGMIPIVGAFTAGALAVLVALADQGLAIALVVLALNVVVQQLEGNLLEPLIVGRATRLHPLVVLTAVTAGGITLGILGAFIAVPVTASLTRIGEYVRERRDSVRKLTDTPPR